ncbi:hypothetical protein [Vulcanisaeta sp. JCM 14467]|uniref:hypothetical protein n=1 Tax=Vulcanisaeta sp. JCM 14467 TaxID=1295370 RepID=UPI0006D265EB|nr:hypothetical protein [Vulcanisaeta sp. JCM 14467]
MDVSLILGIVGPIVTIVVILGTSLYWLGGKFKEIDMRFQQIDQRFNELKNYVDERFNRLVNIITGQNEFLTEFLGFRGILDSRDVSFVKSVLRSMVNMATNPFTEAEKKRLLELIDKDELTLEEANELLELARKFAMEYGDRGPDVWKVLWYAAAMRGITLRKLEEKKAKERQGESAGT